MGGIMFHKRIWENLDAHFGYLLEHGNKILELERKLTELDAYAKRNVAQIAEHDFNYDMKVDNLELAAKPAPKKRGKK
jgi:hypothetical protein